MNNSIEKLPLSQTIHLVGGTIELVEGSIARSNDDPSCNFKPESVVDGKYHVIRLLGQGGMGAVYKVRHDLLRKDMALKTIMRRNLSGQAWQRFQREAQAIAKLRHKNIVEVFDFGIGEGNLPYYTMELLDGESLAQRLARLGPCDTSMALEIFIQVAEAMAYAHRHQIVHRDIKPANIFLVQPDASGVSVPQVKIVDFGIAKLATEASMDNQYTTKVGTVFGSPLYMSPEQSLGVPVDQRSDIYSFGCSLFHTLTGSPPFVGDNVFATLSSHQSKKPPLMRDVFALCQSSQRLDSIVARLLAKQPSERFQTFDQVRDELAYCLGRLQEKPISTPAGTDVKAAGRAQGDQGKKHTYRGIFKKLVLAAALVSPVSGLFFFRGYDFRPPTVIGQKRTKTEQQKALVRTGDFAAVSEPGRINGLDKTCDPAPKGTVRQNFFPVQYIRGQSGNTRTFVFPPGENRARLVFTGLREPIICSGRCTVPVDEKLKLVAIEGLRPEFIRGFRPDDLEELQLQPALMPEWTEEHMEAISHLSGLRVLDISQSELDGKAIPYINKLGILDQLKVGSTRITGQDLLQLKILNHLTLITASRVKDFPLFLRRMPNSPTLAALIACHDDLGDEDAVSIARFVNLRSLFLAGNHFTQKGLKSLEPLSKLTYLSINKMGPESIEPLSHFRHLSRLYIDCRSWPPLEKLRLKRAFPNCRILTNGKSDLID
jgi:serine/threonine protein kinase